MNEAIKARVISLLEKYPENIRKIAQLRYELEHPSKVSPSEVIETMALGHKDGDGISPTGYVSDKTRYIALNYQEEVAKLKAEAVEGIAGKLFPLEREVGRLEYYVGLLNERQAIIIRRHYFDGLTLVQLGSDLRLSPKTLRKLKNEAIDTLAEMYEYSGAVS